MNPENLSKLFLVTLVTSSCALEPVPDLEVGGKADNFYSDVAEEYEVSGTLPVGMTAAQYANVSTRNDLVARRLTAFGLYLTTYMTDKLSGVDENGDGVISEDEIFFHNNNYGGFHAMVRNYTVDPVEVDPGPNGYTVRFTIDVAGPKNLLGAMGAVPGVTTTASGVSFDLREPQGVTIDPANVPWGEIRRFDPATATGALETVRCAMRALPEPADAYPQYNAFFADGVFDVTLFYGYDYTSARADLAGARDAFTQLVQLGFTAPVARFEDLQANSGPFVRTIHANERPVRVEVRVFHSDQFTTNRRGQHDLALSELATRDVFFYNGHAGPYYGFYLDAAQAAQVSPQEITAAPFQRNRQQLFMAQGCQTYSQYADALYASAAKSEDNLDVIVTVNFSYGQGTLDVLRALIRTDASGNHQPSRYYEIVGQLNANYINQQYNVFYGVTGIDGNPQLAPYANFDALGQTCVAATDCGDPSGNVCLSYQGKQLCAVETLTVDACPGGTVNGIFQINGVGQGVCLKVPAPPPPPTATVSAGDIVISELMPNPDASADSAGEWVELYNRTSHSIDLHGCTIGDEHGESHTIGTLRVAAHAYVALASSTRAGFTPDYVFGSGVRLSNTSDQVVLKCGGSPVDRVAYSGAVHAGQSFSLSASMLDATANDAQSAFCYGSAVYATSGTHNDRGTPRAANPTCP